MYNYHLIEKLDYRGTKTLTKLKILNKIQITQDKKIVKKFLHYSKD